MKIGDKVVCIDDSPCRCTLCNRVDLGIKKGQIYNIIGLLEMPLGLTISLTNVLGCPSYRVYYGCFIGADRFRLIEKSKTKVKKSYPLEVC